MNCRSHINLFICFLIIFVSVGCTDNHKKVLSGDVFGTYYAITYLGKDIRGLSEEIDSIFHKVNLEFSTFDTNSLMSKINKNEISVLTENQQYIFQLSKEIHQLTEGAFDPTLLPLIEFWGFRDLKNDKMDTLGLDSVMQFVGIENVSTDDGILIKKNGNIRFSFDAIAKGYAVDLVAAHLKRRGCDNFVVDIGGEIVTFGKNGNDFWKVGIQTPTQTADGPIESTYVFESQDYAIATSGNYRNYIETGNGRYSHILNPATGFSEKSNLLSVSVIAPNCATADAYATAFMVMGMVKTKRFVSQHPELKVYFIYDEDGVFKTASVPAQ